MNKVLHWLQRREQKLFRWVNGRKRPPFLEELLGRITHLGGATAVISINLLLAFLTTSTWRRAAIASLISLAVSHLPVAVIKKKYPRLRPYLVLPGTITGSNPLKDHSFPSGHSTAIFAGTVPYVMAYPLLGFILVPLAVLVSYSRMYLGLHYPSDCIVGALLGTGAAIGISILCL